MNGALLPEPPLAYLSTRPRILLADDDPALTRAIARVLRDFGYDVVMVCDGREAITAAMRTQFDVVVSDIQMPGLTGVELLRELRAFDLDVPVVLMTADPSVATAAQAVEHGAFRYLVKPIEMAVLRSTIECATQLHHAAILKREALKELGAPATRPSDRAGLATRFNSALDSLRVAWQPIVSTGGARVHAYEALLRCDEASLPNPYAVLEAAEQLGRLPTLGRRMRGLAARTFVPPRGDALLFVNLHPDDLRDEELAAGGTPLAALAHRVVLEITERAPLDGLPNLRANLAALRKRGYRIALDDLGAGYAGLSSFATLEPDFVKLDISLVRGVDRSLVRARLVEAMVDLCGKVGAHIIAEGVERGEERDALRRIGCDLMQGYFFARPSSSLVDLP